VKTGDNFMPCGALKSKNVLAGSVILVIIMLTTMVMPCFATESVPVKFERFHNVLLAEDNKTNQLVVKSILEQIGINTIIAGDGKEAVELYKEHADNIDLVLMDLHMPVMNGYEAAEKIREVSAKVPIVAMTADVILGVREKCEQSGIYHYISKPFNPEQFIQTIKDIILENEPGIDTQTAMLDRQTGLMNMGGNEKLYNEVLKEYCNENQDTLERLDAAVRGKRYADAGQIVHKLKGSSGSLGAKALQDTAMELQKALEEGDEGRIAPLHDRFSKLFRELLKELRHN